jgi:hypothetical protein
MQDTLKTGLKVNDASVDLNEFAHNYITRIVLCAVSMLKGGQDVKSLVFDLDGDNVSLTINGKKVPLTPFPRAAVIGTFTGMVSALRGVDKIHKLQIDISSMS